MQAASVSNHTRETRSHLSLLQLLLHHGHAFRTCLRWFKQLPLVTGMTFCMIGITLALPTGLFVLLHNTQSVTKNWQGSGQISLYLQNSITPDQLKSLQQKLQLREDVQSVLYISPEEGLKNFSDQSGFGDVLSQLPNNPLPPVIEVIPALRFQSPQLMQQLLHELQQLPNITNVKLDLQWLTRLQAIIEIGRHGVVALFILFGFAVLLVVGYTVRLTAQNQRKVIEVMQLMGATHAFIRRPFLHAGSVYGVVGAVIAWGLVSGFLWWMQAPVMHLVSLYSGNFQLQPLGFADGICLLILGTILGWMSSYIVVTLQLKR